MVIVDRDIVEFEGSSFLNREGSVDPLRVIWADENEREVSIDLKKGAKEYDGRVLPKKDVERVLEEEEWSVLGLWMNDSFVKLYYCLSMPTEGFEGEILLFWRRMEETKNIKGNSPEKKKKNPKGFQIREKIEKTRVLNEL